MSTGWLQDELVLSDSDKLEYVENSGQRACKLSLQQSWIDSSFSDFGHFTEVDAGTNITVAGGVIQCKGSSAWDANGVRTTLVSTANPGALRIQIKMREKGIAVIGFTRDAAGLDYDDEVPKFYFDASGNLLILEKNAFTRRCLINSLIDVDDVINLYAEWDWVGSLQVLRLCAAVPDLLDVKYCLFEMITDNTTATIGLQCDFYTAFSTPWEIEELEYLNGYDTGGEDGSIVKDAGAGNTWDGSELATLAASLAAPDGIDYTNVTFDWSYDDGSASYTTGRTLAQLTSDMQAINTDKRYFRLKGNLNSDAATQVVMMLPNMPDVPITVAASGGYPSEDDVRDGTTFGPATEYEGNLELPAEAEVIPGVSYGTDGTEYDGAADLPALNKVAPSDTLLGETGTMDLPALTSVDPLDTLEGETGTMDVPDLAGVIPDDTLRGSEGTADLPDWENVLNVDTLLGDPGEAYVAASLIDVYPMDVGEALESTFERGDTIKADVLVKFNAALVDAEVSLILVHVTEGVVANLWDAVEFSFDANTSYDATEIDEDYPSYVFEAGDTIGGYYLELTISHASLASGGINVQSMLALVDLPALDAVDPLDTLQDAAGTMDLPALASIITTDTLRGEPGTYAKPRFLQSGGAAVGSTLIAKALLGQTINLDLWTITSDTDKTGVTVNAYLYKIVAGTPTPVANLGGASVDFTASTPVSVGTALGSPTIDVTSYGVGEFIGVVAVTVDPGGSRYFYSGYAVPDFPAVGNVLTVDTVDGAEGTFDEAARNTVPTLSLIPSEANGGPAPWLQLNVEREGTGSGGGGTPPTAPSWSALPTAGDAQVTLAVAADAETDTIYARYRRLNPVDNWSAESEAFSCTGSDDIVVTGLTNGQPYEFAIYSKSGSLVSALSAGTRFSIPTDGSEAYIDLVMNAVVAQLNAAGITDENSVTVTASKEIPPTFDNITVPVFKIFPDTETAEAARNRNDISPRVTIAYCRQSKTEAARTAHMRIRERVRDLFLGRRLTALPSAACVSEDDSGVVDLDRLWSEFKWVSVVTLEFQALRRPS